MPESAALVDTMNTPMAVAVINPADIQELLVNAQLIVPVPFCIYQRQVVAYAQKYGFLHTAKLIGIGKTTIYRWQKELR